MVYKIKGDIVAVEQIIGKKWLSGVGKDAKFYDVTEGWRVRFSVFGGAFAIMFDEEPSIRPGPITLTIESRNG